MIGQTPTEGAKAEKGEPVAILIAVGSGKVDVPNITGMKLDEAEKALRDKNLTLGQASPQPADPEGKIESQIPAANEIVKAGTPVDIFYPDPADAENKKKNADKDKKGGGGAGGEKGDEKGGGAGAADIVVPAIGKDDTLDAYAKKLGDLGIVPVVSKQFDDCQAGHAVRHRPARRHQGGHRRQGQGARLGRPAAGRLHQRQGHPAPQRRDGRQARPRGHHARREGGRPDLDRRRRSSSPTSPTGA